MEVTSQAGITTGRRFPDTQRPIQPWDRVKLIAGALVIVVLFLLAAGLKPDPSGMGTHRQLGLPPCSFQFLSGLPCPTCGFTTTWSHLMHGNWMAAMRTNFAAVLLWLFAAGSGLWMLISGLQGRWFVGLPSVYIWSAAVVPIVITTAVVWISRVLQIINF